MSTPYIPNTTCKVIIPKDRDFYPNDEIINPRLAEIQEIAERLLKEDLTKGAGLTPKDPQFQLTVNELKEAMGNQTQ